MDAFKVPLRSVIPRVNVLSIEPNDTELMS